jgi:hypothetical protein
MGRKPCTDREMQDGLNTACAEIQSKLKKSGYYGGKIQIRVIRCGRKPVGVIDLGMPDDLERFQDEVFEGLFDRELPSRTSHDLTYGAFMTVKNYLERHECEILTAFDPRNPEELDRLLAYIREIEMIANERIREFIEDAA